MRVVILTAVLSLALFTVQAAARADDPEPAAKTPSVYPLRFGIDAYAGVSGLEGFRRSSDGFWAGSGTEYPSSAYVHYQGERGQEAKLSLGIGRMYQGSDTTLRQPLEAWWQAPAGQARIMVGKFWVPFGVQEWEYETKPGLMLSWDHRGTQLALSGNYTRETGAGTMYARLGRKFSDSAGIGVSLARGRGLSYGSRHDRGWDVAGSAAMGGLRGY